MGRALLVIRRESVRRRRQRSRCGQRARGEHAVAARDRGARDARISGRRSAVSAIARSLRLIAGGDRRPRAVAARARRPSAGLRRRRSPLHVGQSLPASARCRARATSASSCAPSAGRRLTAERRLVHADGHAGLVARRLAARARPARVMCSLSTSCSIISTTGMRSAASRFGGRDEAAARRGPLAQLIPSDSMHALLTPDISFGEKIIRTMIVYAFLLIGLRLAGKRSCRSSIRSISSSCCCCRTRCRTRSSAMTIR